MIRGAAVLVGLGAVLVVIGVILGELAWSYAAIGAAVVSLTVLAFGTIRRGPDPSQQTEPSPSDDRTGPDPDGPPGPGR